MTKKALDVNELMCDNNTVKTHHINRSDLKKKTWLSRKDLFFPLLQYIYIYIYICVCLYNIYYVYVCVCIYILYNII